MDKKVTDIKSNHKKNKNRKDDNNIDIFKICL